MVISIEAVCEQYHVFLFWCNYLISLGLKAGWSVEKIDAALDETIDGWIAEYKRIKSQAAS